MLTTQTIPRTLVLTGGIERAEEIVGKVSTAPMFMGEQALTSKVTSFEGQNTLAYKVPEGMRGLSVQVPHEAWIAAGLVQPGDRVDVLAITVLMRTDPLTGEEEPNITAAVIAQDVEVLAVSQALIKSVPNLDAKKDAAAASSTETPATDATPAAAEDPSTNVQPLESTDTYEKAISLTLAVPPETAAGIAIIDAMKDDAAQYRVMPRQKGDTGLLSGTITWTLEDIISSKKR
jgi:Flp pilus assembly protein CpaB